jgi:hypothetical protein
MLKKDLQEMKVKRLGQKAVDRKEWASVIKEAKALGGQYSQRVSKCVGSYIRWLNGE